MNDDDWKPPERSLGEDGRLTGKPEKRRTGADESSGPKAEAPVRLELAERFGRVKKESEGTPLDRVYRDVAPTPRRFEARWAALVFFSAGALALLALWLFPRVQQDVGLLPSARAETMVIDSQPSGAQLRIAGASVGQTPWAGSNRWAGTVNFELSLGGYQTYRGTFRGGEKVLLSVPLKKR